MSGDGPERGSNGAISRSRGGRPVTGVAAVRDNSYYGGGGAYLGNPYPWYGAGSFYYGYPIYNPYYYSSYAWNRYGAWYDPYNPVGYYDPMYDPGLSGGYVGGSGGGGSSYSSSSSGPAPRNEATGTIRVRVKPSSAQVYLDGNFIGVVDQFDGLTSHLAAPVGRHEVEIRADGYAPLKMLVEVEEDKTITARGSMKKK